MSRIAARFNALKAAHKKAFIPFLSAGDPDLETSAALLAGLPGAGVDLIEIGMPFSDPVADGPAIECGNLRAFKAGITMRKILALVTDFRQKDADTPVILMGYANPVYSYGLEAFAHDAVAAGVDGLIVADLPHEEDADLRAAAQRQGLDIIRLIAPTTPLERLPTILTGVGGFAYYVSIAGTTGTKEAQTDPVRRAVEALRPHTQLPIGVGFGITTPEQAHAIAQVCDAVIVGSAIVKRIAANLDAQGHANPSLVNDVLGFIETLAQATHRG